MNRPTTFLLAILSAFALPAFAKVSPDEFVAACAAGDVAKVSKLLAAGANVEAPNKLGHAPLLTAMLARKAEVVALLLQRGADPNAEGRCPERDCTGHPALIFAAYLDDPKLVKLLLDAKADVAWRDHLVTRRTNFENKVEIFKLLRAAGGRESSTPAPEEKPPAAAPLPSGLAELLPAAKNAAPRTAGENLRVAIVADETMQAAGELLASELTGGGVQLVERAELDRVLAEQKLTRAFGDDAARAQQVGRLLHADALALLRKVDLDGRALAELRVVRISPGIVLGRAYRAWPLADAAAWAGDAAQSARTLLAKVRPARALALSLADIRSISATPTGEALAREAALLLAERLQRQPDVVLLERAAATDLARETALGKPGAFWAGSYLVSGSVEPPLDGGGEAAFALRFTPVGGGEPLTFNVRGPRAKSAVLIDGLIAQAAQKLTLAAVPPAGQLAEAARYFAESRAARASGSYLEAYRHAETAALLGLRTPEFLAGRLVAIFDVIEWQATRMDTVGWVSGSPDMVLPEETRRAAWDEKFLKTCFGNMERLGPAEWLEVGAQVVPLWRELVRETFAAPTPQGVETVLNLMPEAVAVPIFVREMLHTASGQIAFGDRLREAAPAVLTALVEALAQADRSPDLAEAASRIAISIAWNAPLLCEDEATFASTLHPLLARHFSAMDLPTRAEIRRIILKYLDYQQVNIRRQRIDGSSDWDIALFFKNPAVAGARAGIISATEGDESDESVLFREAMRWQIGKGVKAQAAQSEVLFAALTARKPLFTGEPFTASILDSISYVMHQAWERAPKFNTLSRKSPVEKFGPEMLALRTELERAFQAGGSAVELEEPAGNAVIWQVDRTLPVFFQKQTPRQPVPLPAPKPVLAGTPTFADAPPLAVRRSWQPMEALPDGGLDFLLSKSTLFCEADRLWFYAENETRDGQQELRGAVFELALPSLRAKVWRLPAHMHDSEGRRVLTYNGLCVDADHIYLARCGEYFAVCERQTGKWNMLRDVRPYGSVHQVGDACYFLTGDDEDRGFARYTPADGKVELLASRRRVPGRTPLDDPALNVHRLDLTDDGRFEIYANLRKAKPRPESIAAEFLYCRFGYDPATRQWSTLQEPGPYIPPPSAFTPLKRPGPAKAYQKTILNDVWTLQLASEAMPKARLPLAFQNAPDSDPGMDYSRHMNPPPNSDAATVARYRLLEKRARSIPEGETFCFWTPHGYILTGSDSDQRTLWFLPQSDVEAYLRKHQPKMDETKSSPPVPTAPAAK